MAAAACERTRKRRSEKVVGTPAWRGISGVRDGPRCICLAAEAPPSLFLPTHARRPRAPPPPSSSQPPACSPQRRHRGRRLPAALALRRQRVRPYSGFLLLHPICNKKLSLLAFDATVFGVGVGMASSLGWKDDKRTHMNVPTIKLISHSSNKMQSMWTITRRCCGRRTCKFVLPCTVLILLFVYSLRISVCIVHSLKDSLATYQGLICLTVTHLMPPVKIEKRPWAPVHEITEDIPYNVFLYPKGARQCFSISMKIQ